MGDKIGTTGDAEGELIGDAVGGDGLSGGAHHVAKKEATESSADADGPEFIWIMEEVLVEGHEDVVTEEGPDRVGNLAGEEEFSKVLNEVCPVNRGVRREGVLAEIVEKIRGIAEGAGGFTTGGGAHSESDQVKLKGGNSGWNGRVRRGGRIQRVRVHFPEDFEVVWGQESSGSRIEALECRAEVAVAKGIGNEAVPLLRRRDRRRIRLRDRRLCVEAFEHFLETTLTEEKETVGNEAFVLARLRRKRGGK